LKEPAALHSTHCVPNLPVGFGCEHQARELALIVVDILHPGRAEATKITQLAAKQALVMILNPGFFSRIPIKKG